MFEYVRSHDHSFYFNTLSSILPAPLSMSCIECATLKVACEYSWDPLGVYPFAPPCARCVSLDIYCSNTAASVCTLPGCGPHPGDPNARHLGTSSPSNLYSLSHISFLVFVDCFRRLSGLLRAEKLAREAEISARQSTRLLQTEIDNYRQLLTAGSQDPVAIFDTLRKGGSLCLDKDDIDRLRRVIAPVVNSKCFLFTLIFLVISFLFSRQASTCLVCVVALYLIACSYTIK